MFCFFLLLRIFLGEKLAEQFGDFDFLNSFLEQKSMIPMFFSEQKLS